jgi:hypothetical protein
MANRYGYIDVFVHHCHCSSVELMWAPMKLCHLETRTLKNMSVESLSREAISSGDALIGKNFARNSEALQE